MSGNPMNNDTDWNRIQNLLPKGSLCECIVKQHTPFGLFVAVPGWNYTGVIEIINIKDKERVTQQDFPPLGSKLVALVLGHDGFNKQICLGTKPSQLAVASGSQRLQARSVEFGIRILPDNSLEFFGLEEVNRLICEGYSIVAIEKGQALMTKAAENEKTVRLIFSGFVLLAAMHIKSS